MTGTCEDVMPLEDELAVSDDVAGFLMSRRSSSSSAAAAGLAGGRLLLSCSAFQHIHMPHPDPMKKIKQRQQVKDVHSFP